MEAFASNLKVVDSEVYVHVTTILEYLQFKAENAYEQAIEYKDRDAVAQLVLLKDLIVWFELKVVTG